MEEFNCCKQQICHTECNVHILKFEKSHKHACGRCGYHICGKCKIKKNLKFYPFYPENTCRKCNYSDIDFEIKEEYLPNEQIEFNY